jgi:hypothetical protein
MYGQRARAPSGFEVVMNTNHHLSKPAMIGKLEASGTFDVVWRSISPIKASIWSRYLPDSAKRIADWTFPGFAAGVPSRQSRIGDSVVSIRIMTDRKLKDAAAQALSIMAKTTAGLERVPR